MDDRVTELVGERLDRMAVRIDKRAGSGFVIGFLLGCGAVCAAPARGHNGLFWSQLGKSAKQAYLAGFADGTAVAFARLEELEFTVEVLHWRSGKKLVRQLSSDLKMPPGTCTDTAAKLDRLYEDPRYAELDISGALELLSTQESSASARRLSR